VLYRAKLVNPIWYLLGAMIKLLTQFYLQYCVILGCDVMYHNVVDRYQILGGICYLSSGYSE